MKTSTQIEKEIADLQQRREVVAEAHAHAGRGLAAARTALVHGKGSTEAVAAAQSAFTGLDGALADADGMLADLRGELAAARTSETSATNAARIDELKRERERLQTEYDRTRANANAMLSTAAAKMLELGNLFHAAEKELSALLPAGSSAVFSHRQGPTDQPLQFGEPLASATRIVSNEADRQRLKAQSRANAERDRLIEARRVAVAGAA